MKGCYLPIVCCPVCWVLYVQLCRVVCYGIVQLCGTVWYGMEWYCVVYLVLCDMAWHVRLLFDPGLPAAEMHPREARRPTRVEIFQSVEDFLASPELDKFQWNYKVASGHVAR